MPGMARRRRRRRKRRDEGAAFRVEAFRVAAMFARVALVLLVAVAVGYAFYAALRWVADLAAGRG